MSAKNRGIEQLKSDLRFVFRQFPIASLFHLRSNQQRLIRGNYTDGKGGCLFNLLSEPLSPEKRIDRAPKLTEYFTGGSGHPFKEFLNYQPARRLVRAIDGACASQYEGVRFLSWELVLEVLEEAISERLHSGVSLQACKSFDWLHAAPLEATGPGHGLLRRRADHEVATEAAFTAV